MRAFVVEADPDEEDFRMQPRVLIATLVVAAATSGTATANHDDSGDGTTRCDRWWRMSHTETATDKDSHDHEASSDVEVAPGVVLHGHSGHYVVRTDAGYVEVVGGNAYRGPDPEGADSEGQGGYVQGEVDAGSGTPDADFHANAFGPDDRQVPPSDPAAWLLASHGGACGNVAGRRVAQETP